MFFKEQFTSLHDFGPRFLFQKSYPHLLWVLLHWSLAAVLLLVLLVLLGCNLWGQGLTTFSTRGQRINILCFVRYIWSLLFIFCIFFSVFFFVCLLSQPFENALKNPSLDYSKTYWSLYHRPKGRTKV